MSEPQHPAELTLTSHVRSSSDLAGRSVAFFVVTTEFKQPEYLSIGTATTTASGVASVSYKPTWSGETQFVARLSGSHAQPLSAAAHFHVTASTPGPLAATANPKRPLASVGHVFLATILSIVGAVWLTLIVILLLVSRRLPRLASDGSLATLRSGDRRSD